MKDLECHMKDLGSFSFFFFLNDGIIDFFKKRKWGDVMIQSES